MNDDMNGGINDDMNGGINDDMNGGINDDMNGDMKKEVTSKTVSFKVWTNLCIMHEVKMIGRSKKHAH